MKIEVACEKEATTKEKGDLLEKLSKDLLKAQGFDVINEIRFTGVEIDLLCKHRVSGKVIYVECKAQKEKIGAPVLRQLLGTVTGYDYTEGWIISTSEFGKEAKGFVEMWKKKPPEQSSNLSFYPPVTVIDALKRASIICNPPIEKAEKIIGGSEFLGEWVLLVTSYGRYWAVYTLQGGAPAGVLVFNAINSRHIEDDETLSNLSDLNSSLTDYDLKIGVKSSFNDTSMSLSASTSVVEVQVADSWDDYRPARPQDFVGRDETQKEILSFLSNAETKNSDTRIFSITGNSGLGKSSLIAKVRDRSKNKHYKNRYFIFAVDVRGAKSPSYIPASLLNCLKAAQAAGFGDPIDLQLTDPSAPLSSPSIINFLESIEKKKQVICLIFDQFEELYSKTELFGVFSSAKDLILDVASFKGNFVLGFAWKTDSTTHQDNPAYHMWHDLSDYRRVYKLDVFDKGEITKAITIFEKEVKLKIPIEIRHQIVHSCQGFPWLIKKLCINLHQNIKKDGGADSTLIDLDVEQLFKSDLDLLTKEELTSLRIIAQNAPADWSEMIETSGVAVVNGLVNKRQVVKSGDRLNIYWDIFKDYLLTGKVPVIPFNYVPTSDSYSLLKVFRVLDGTSYIESNKIAQSASLKERTVWNIGADLVMFGLAERKGTRFRYHRELNDNSVSTLLQILREKLGKHSLKLALYKNYAGKTVDKLIITEVLKPCLPRAKFNERTWTTYVNRLTKYFIQAGYFVQAGGKIVIQDLGSPVSGLERLQKKGKQRSIIFPASASPAAICETLKFIRDKHNEQEIIDFGYRNALSVVKRFELATILEGQITLNNQSINKYGGDKEAIWTLAKNEPVIALCINKIRQMPNIYGLDLGIFVSSEYNMNWTIASMQRNGNSLKQWSGWVNDGIENSSIPEPPGRIK